MAYILHHVSPAIFVEKMPSPPEIPFILRKMALVNCLPEKSTAGPAGLMIRLPEAVLIVEILRVPSAVVGEEPRDISAFPLRYA